MADIVLLVSFEASQDATMKTVKGDLEKLLRNDNIEVNFIVDVNHKFKKLSGLPKKLEKTLEKAKVVAIVTSPTVCAIRDKSQLQTALSKVNHLDEASAKILLKFIDGERTKSKPKLVLMSLEDAMQTTDYFKGVHHLAGMLKGNGEGIGKWIAGKR